MNAPSEQANDFILIADGNSARASRVVATLEAAGHRCKVAAHGAEAIEIALAEQPIVLVTHEGLPLVDPQKVAEILRANPRTRSARFLFLGVEGAGTPNLPGVGDASLPIDAETDEIRSAIEALLDRQERIESLESRAGDDREFEGSLEQLNPSELLQMLNVRRSTGRLTLTAVLPNGSAPDGVINVKEGEIHSAATGLAGGEKALFRMLDWRLGDFLFEPAAVTTPADIDGPTRSVLAEGMRQLDEWNRLSPGLPLAESPVSLRVDRAELPHIVHPLTHEVLGLVEKASCVGDVVEQSHHPDYQVLRTLHTLEERGIVEFGRAMIAPADAPGHALFNEAQYRRLRSFAQPGGADTAMPVDCKLLIVAADPGILSEFAGLLVKVQGTDLSPRFERGLVGENDLESIGRIDLDGDFGIDLVHLPSSEGYEALWPFAGHGALGAIFLLDSGAGSRAGGLTAVSDALCTGSPARAFHVVLLAEGERLSPDELRANLAVIDEANLFLLPIEEDQDPSSVLRSLFARVVP